MLVVKARNVNTALPEACRKLLKHKVERDSRVGRVWTFPVPVTTWYTHPRERVLFDARRDANPFFHLMECIWMVGGRDDLKTISRYTSGLDQFSDDGLTLAGAYGFRWRKQFSYDQLGRVIYELRGNPSCRRQVITMYDPVRDGCSAPTKKDIPCNTHLYFRVNAKEEVDLTVLNRSNDIIWGCYGANVVHFSFLQELVAAHLGRKVGGYWQVSNDLHAYERHHKLVKYLAEQAEEPLRNQGEPAYPDTFPVDPLVLQESHSWLDKPSDGASSQFLRRVAYPAAAAYAAFKVLDPPERYDRALEALEVCAAEDWRIACAEWIKRRKQKWKSQNS